MLKTFEVRIGAYRNQDLKASLTHACEVDQDGNPLVALCRIKLTSLLQDGSATDEAPTCPVCAKKWDHQTQPVSV